MKIFRLLIITALSLAFAAPSFAKSFTRARLISWPNPSKLGQPAVLLAEIDGLGGGAPKGIVTFTEGDTVLGSRPINPYGAGQATMAAGLDHSCALTEAGGVACWGSNSGGQIGDGTTTDRLAPVLVPGLTRDVVAVAAGENYSCALTRAGAVKCWGSGLRLGEGSDRDQHRPVDVVGLGSGVVTIAAGPSHACALTRGGAAKCWGDNTWDKLGNVGDGRTPVTVSRPTSGIVAIAAGWGHSCLLTKGGAVKCWGLNNEGQVGDGTTVDRFQPVDVAGLDRGVVAIAAGSLHTCALISGGAVKCWGANGVGSLGDGTQTRRTTPVSVMGLASGVVAITAKSGHSCATTRDGAAKCWGLNFLGQLGNGAQRNRVFPVDVTGLSSGVVAITAGSSHSCALTMSGVVKCWGYNSTGQIGDGTTTIRRTPATVSGFAALVRSRTWISTRTLGLGAHGLRATYPGDALHGASSGTLAQTVVD